MKAADKYSASLVLIITFITSISTALSDHFPQYSSLNGEWKMIHGDLLPSYYYIPSSAFSPCHKVTVPGNLYLQGFNVSSTAWYRKDFRVGKLADDKIFHLIFDGVDYNADVWLNGVYLGFHEGSFQSFQFDITDCLQTDVINTLVLKVSSPKEYPEPGWSLHKTQIKGVFAHHDTRPGGAWSPRSQDANSIGIWDNVRIRKSLKIFTDSLSIRSDVDLNKNIANLKIIFKLDNLYPDPKDINISISLRPYNFISRSSSNFYIFNKTIDHGSTQFKYSVNIHKPKLWYTWDYGRPNLYILTLRIKDSDNFIYSSESSIIAFRSIFFDDAQNSFFLNGLPIFLRGSNYISTHWLSEMNREKYLRDLLLMKKANMNSVRVHAHIEKPIFYHLCDSLGISVWQDFPLQWGYSDSPEFQQKACSMAIDMVNQLNNHPSIFVWSLHNEPPWDSKWMKYKYKNYNPNANQELDQALYKTVKPYDPSRHTDMISNTSEHLWYGWYHGSYYDFVKPAKVPFITEFGAQALPEFATLSTFLSPEEMSRKGYCLSAKWAYHNFQKRETFKFAKIDTSDNIHDFIENSQNYQARLTKYAIESLRLQKHEPVACLYHFMFNEAWPSINWGILDYLRKPKAAYYDLMNSYQPVLPIAKINSNSPNDFKSDIFIVNDLLYDYPDIRFIINIDKFNTNIFSDTLYTSAKASLVNKILAIHNKHISAGNYKINMKILAPNGNIISSNHKFFSIK